MTRARKPLGRLVVVGAGVAGLSAAWSARVLGFAVTCVEARRIGNASGSSAGLVKIFRYAYDDERYAHLLVDTEQRWRELEKNSGTPLIQPCPGLNIGKAGSSAIASIIASLEAVRREFEVLKAGDARLEAFGIRLSEDEVAVLELGAGLMEPSTVVRALAGEVRKLGVELREQTAAFELMPSGDGVVVRTSAGDIHADRVIVAVGPWVLDLIDRPSVPLTVTRQHQLTFTTARPVGNGERFAWAEITRDDSYGVANHNGLHLIGNHTRGPVGRHAEGRQTPSDLTIVNDRLTEFCTRLTIDLDIERVESRVCHYTNTPDGAFLVSEYAALPSAIVLSACSGHGFKFALSTGRQAAELAAR